MLRKQRPSSGKTASTGASPAKGPGTGKDPGLRRLEQFVTAVSEPVVIISAGGVIEAANDAFRALIGMRHDEFLSRPFYEFCAMADEAGKAMELFGQGEGRRETVEIGLETKDGRCVPVSVTALPVSDGGHDRCVVTVKDLRDKISLTRQLSGAREELAGRISCLEDFREGVFHMLKDIDKNERELEEAYRKLKETQAQLVQSSKLIALGELSAGLAHELNQPLTVIKGLSQYLLRACPTESPEHEKLKLIVEASGKMEQVIKHLRVFSRTDGLAVKPVDLNDLIKETFLIVKELLVSGTIEIVLDLKPVPEIIGSANRLEQVVINIVSNAKDAMPGGGRLTISTDTEDRAGTPYAILEISDTGSGIPRDIIDKIFDPFFTTKEAGKGTGLGLSISYGIINEHGGAMTVESVPGKGTAFRIAIPAAVEKP